MRFQIRGIIELKNEWLISRKNADQCLFSILLEMLVQSLNLIVEAAFVLELVKRSPFGNLSQAKFLWPWKLYHQIPFKHIFCLDYHMQNFTSNKSFLCSSKKINIWITFVHFPFLIKFFCLNEVNKKSSIIEDTRFIVQEVIL